MTYGKHKGKTFEEVMAEDPTYCTWVLSASTDSTGDLIMVRFQRRRNDDIWCANPWAFLANDSAEKTKYIDVSQPSHQGNGR